MIKKQLVSECVKRRKRNGFWGFGQRERKRMEGTKSPIMWKII